MKTSKGRFFALAIASVAAILTTESAQASFEYDWTGGAAGYSGKIFLSSASSTAGTLADIQSGSFLTTPEGTFSFDPSTVYVFQTPFAWNTSQITDMWIDWTVPGGGLAGWGQNYVGNGVNFEGSYVNNLSIDFSGSWLAVQPVPEPSTYLAGVLMLLPFGLQGIRFIRNRKA